MTHPDTLTVTPEAVKAMLTAMQKEQLNEEVVRAIASSVSEQVSRVKQLTPQQDVDIAKLVLEKYERHMKYKKCCALFNKARGLFALIEPEKDFFPTPPPNESGLRSWLALCIKNGLTTRGERFSLDAAIETMTRLQTNFQHLVDEFSLSQSGGIAGKECILVNEGMKEYRRATIQNVNPNGRIAFAGRHAGSTTFALDLFSNLQNVLAKHPDINYLTD